MPQKNYYRSSKRYEQLSSKYTNTINSATKRTHLAKSKSPIFSEKHADQSLMERFISGLNLIDIKKFQTSKGKFKKITQWDGLSFDSDRALSKIDWFDRFESEGMIDIQFLPPTVKILSLRKCLLKSVGDLSKISRGLETLCIAENPIGGVLSVSDLPRNLRHLDVSFTQINGEFNFSSLPSNLTDVVLKGNYLLTGRLDLGDLPEQLVSLDVSYTNFTGQLQSEKLPSTLKILEASSCDFSGMLDFTQLPDKLEVLDIGCNKFFGPMDLTRLPESLRDFNAESNAFSGPIDLTQLPPKLSALKLHGNRLNNNISLENLPKGIKWLDLSGNVFSGRIVIQQWPPQIAGLILDKNNFESIAFSKPFPKMLDHLQIDFPCGFEVIQGSVLKIQQRKQTFKLADWYRECPII